MRELRIVLMLALLAFACNREAPDPSGSAIQASSQDRPPSRSDGDEEDLLLLELEVALLADDLRVFERLDARRRAGEFICLGRMKATLLLRVVELGEAIPEARRGLVTPETSNWFDAQVEGRFSALAERVRKKVPAK